MVRWASVILIKEMSKYRNHECIADAKLKAGYQEVRAGITKAVEQLTELSGYEMAKEVTIDEQADFEINYHTPVMNYLDSISVKVEEEVVSGLVFVKIRSVSTNFCPDCFPCSLFRCCCDCFRVFQDGGLNQTHVERFIAQVTRFVFLGSDFWFV